VALIEPRQCGKTTLARELMRTGEASYFDLEDPVALLALESPMSALSPLSGLVVIDEAQRAPGLFPVLRVLADREGQPATFLVLGSASPALSRQVSESLAGRVEIIEMGGFGLAELPAGNRQALWLRGGFPRSFLARSETDSSVWKKNFIRTFLERDLAGLGFGMARRRWGGSGPCSPITTANSVFPASRTGIEAQPDTLRTPPPRSGPKARSIPGRGIAPVIGRLSRKRSEGPPYAAGQARTGASSCSIGRAFGPWHATLGPWHATLGP